MQSNKLNVETMVGGEYPPLKNKTIFAASQCPDEVTKDGAFDGTRIQLRGWKYVASILMFLMLSVGNALWDGSSVEAATYYGKIKIVVVCEGGATGKVAVTTSSSTATSWTNVENGDIVEGTKSGTSKSNAKPYAQAQADAGSHFWGWYLNEACDGATDGLATNSKQDASVFQMSVSPSSTTEANPTTQVLYAKFSNVPYYRYYQKFYVNMADGTAGLLYTDKGGLTGGNDKYYKYNRVALESYYSNFKNTLNWASDKVKTNQSPRQFTVYTRVFHVHGKLLKEVSEWTQTSTNVASVSGENQGDGLYQLTYTINGAEDTPFSNTATNCTIAVTSKDAAPATITIQKKSDRGTISGSVNFFEIESSKLKYRTRNGIAMSSSTSEASFTKCGADLNSDGIPDTTIYAGDQILLTATPEDGCSFLGWYSVDENEQKTFLTSSPTLEQNVSGDVTYYADFSKAACTVISKDEETEFRIHFASLESAIAYANNNANDDREKTILLLDNCTLPAGNYTIPHHTILSIPYSAEQTDAMPYISRINTATVPSSAYCTLTLASGAHIDVFGAVEVGGIMSTGNVEASGTSGISRPGGDTYGLMQMNAGSSMTIYEDANLYAWGFIQGEGTIDMRRGAVAREMFQMYDWKGFSPTANMAMDGSINYTLHVLPINQYYIQNIEVKTTYRPGSKLYGQVGAFVLGMSIGFNDIGIVGVKYSDAEKAADPDLEDDVAIFLMDNEDTSEDTWVCKYYDPSTDQQVFDVNNSAHLGSLVMKIDLVANGIHINNPLNPGHDIVDLDVDSRDFALPLTNNFKIHLLYGNLNVTQSTAMLPGSVIEVNKKGTLTIMDQVWKKVGGVFKWVTEPQTLYLYDKDQWGTYVFDHKDDSYVMGYASRIRYRHGGVPTVRDISSPAGLGDAQLIVHGTVDVKGYLKTTKGDRTARPTGTNSSLTGVTETEHASDDGGASIISTIEDAGTITFSRKPGYESYGSHTSYLWQVDAINSVGELSYFGNHAIPAWLTNEVGYTETAGTQAGKSYCFIDFDGDGKGEWKCLIEDGCFVYDENDVYYAKPQDYVALKNGKTEEADHTYQSADGSRTLILVDDCQWWEVEPVEGHPDLFHCTHPQNNVYYYFDYESSKWLEKRYTVTWLDWDGTEFGDPYILKYGVQPKYLGNIPQREADDYYTYNFIGWSPAITESTIVTGDVTYTAQFERKDRMYMVTWKNEDGNTIETDYCKMGQTPECFNAPDMTGKEWNPAVGAVTGDQTYTLQTKVVKSNYTITWKNWDGTTLQTTTPAANTAAAVVLAGYTAGTPTKPALADIAFEFAGWTPMVVDANADAIYTATFTEHLITYTITWKNYDGTTLLVQDVTPNTVPQYTGATPVHADDSYGFIGWSPTVVAATENKEYVAQFELQNKMVDGETYSIPSSTQQTLTTITIKDDGKLVIPATSSLTVNSLILEATINASGQLDAPSNSNIVAVNAYFDLELNTDARHWRAFGVPWAVDINTNPLVEVETGRTLNISRDYEIMYYDGSERAANGPSAACWKYLRHYDEASQPVEVLQPGRGYMIAFGSHVNTVRFVKKSGAPIIYTGSVGVTAHQIGAISNPMAYHTTMDAGVGVGQVHDGGEIGHDGYDEVTITAKRFVVGKTVYIDPQSTQSVVINKADGNVSPVSAAPARRGAKAMNKKYLTLEDYYTVALINANGEERKVYVLPEEDKEDKYVVGHDLSKMGMSDRKAQIWVNRYDVNLGLNTIAPMDGVAEFPVNIYAPKAGQYTLSLVSEPDEEYTVYLTLNGEAIWNLSSSEYAVELAAGTNKSYGLRLSARKSPTVATGIDEAVVDAQGEIKKVIINDKVFIIRGDQVYSIDGRLAK